MPCNGGPWSHGDDGEGYRLAEKFEKQACAARWLVLQLVAENDPSPQLEGAVAKVRAEQLKHRKADRDEFLSRLNGKLDDLRRKRREIERLGGKPKPAIAEEIRKWMRLKTEVIGRTDAELLETYFGNEMRYPELDR